MKPILFTLIACMVIGTSCAATTDQYRTQLAKCTDAQDTALSNDLGEVAMSKTLRESGNCYVRVGMNVIREYYADTYEETGRAFIKFANALYESSRHTYNGPDICYPECGRISETMRMDGVNELISNYIIQMLDFIDSKDV